MECAIFISLLSSTQGDQGLLERSELLKAFFPNPGFWLCLLPTVKGAAFLLVSDNDAPQYPQPMDMLGSYLREPLQRRLGHIVFITANPSILRRGHFRLAGLSNIGE